jgi:hypothetical protein
MKSGIGKFECPHCQFILTFEEDILTTIKDKLYAIKQELSGLSLTQLKDQVSNPKNPVTMILIGFIAWGIAYFLRFPIFMAVVTALSLLLGPWGLVLIAILPMVYRYHQTIIEEEKKKYEKRKNEQNQSEK